MLTLSVQQNFSACLCEAETLTCQGGASQPSTTPNRMCRNPQTDVHLPQGAELTAHTPNMTGMRPDGPQGTCGGGGVECSELPSGAVLASL